MPFFVLVLLLWTSFLDASLTHIAIVQDGPSELYASMRKAVEAEITDLLSPEIQVKYSSPSHFMGSWTLDSVDQQIQAALDDPDVDIVIGLGLVSSYALTTHRHLAKASFAPLVWGTSPKLTDNLNFLMLHQDIARDLALMEKLKPITHVALIVDSASLTAIPDLSPYLEAAASQAGVKATVMTADASLPTDVDAVYLSLLPRLSSLEVDRLINEINGRCLPSYSEMGRSWVERGVLATLTPASERRRIARRLSLNIQSYLLGEPPSQLKTELSSAQQLVLNLRTASELGITPSWEMLLDAETLHEHELSPIFHLTLLEAIDEAICANSKLAAARKVVNSGAEDVRKALAPLLPQVQVAGIARAIDRNLAQVTLGALPEREFFGAAQATQVIYSNQLLGRYSVERSKQDARFNGYENQFLDTVLEVALAYLDVLRANTLQDIQLSNVRRTRGNLDMARQRVKSGEARSSEVFRWESEVATNRSNAVKASYQARSAQVALNRVLNRCQADPLLIDQVGLDEEFWVLDRQWFDRYIANERVMEALGAFSVQEACRLSPQILQLQHLITAQEKALGVATRAYYSPDVAMAAQVRDRFAEGGAGTVGPLKTNGKEWIVGLAVTYPLLTGGYRGAEKRQACSELQRLNWELEALQSGIEQQIRTSLNNVTASYASIGLSRTSADAANKSLEMATNAYMKGSTTIVDLLDAQNQALIADLVAANSIYDFLIDLIRLQRVIGRFDFLLDEEGRLDVLERLEGFILQYVEDSCA